MSPQWPSQHDPNCLPTDDGIFGLPAEPAAADLVLLPVPWEATASYREGTSRAPRAIHRASFQVELFDCETGHPYQRGIALLEEDPLIVSLHQDAQRAAAESDVDGVDRLSWQMIDRVRKRVVRWRNRDKLVGVLGGEHTVCLGAIRAVAEQVGQLSILQIDAHADLRREYQGYRFSHACTAANMLDLIGSIDSLVQVATRDCCPEEAERIESDARITTLFDVELAGGSEMQSGWRSVIKPLGDNVWISMDIDGLDPALCPHTGTPVPGGLRWREVTSLLAAVGSSGRRIVGFDLCEVVPGPESKSTIDSWDAIVAARLLYKLCGWTLRGGR